METLFDLGLEGASASTLLVEAGQGYLCYAFFEPATATISRLHFSQFAPEETADALAQLLQGLDGNRFGQVVVCSAYPQALLVPRQQFREEYGLLEAVYEVPAGQPRHDVVAEWQLVNMYTLPVQAEEALRQYFPDARFLHTYTPALRIYNGFVSSDQISLHVTPLHFRVIVKKDGQLQLAQTYGYKTPLDVAYILLKICYEFSLQQEEVQVILSGLVEEQSALYRELHSYFLQLHFAQAPELTLPETEHPQHFFTSLYNLAACAS